MARSGEEDRAAHVSPEDVRRLCEFLYRRTGMLFAEDKRYYIDRRLHERIAATGAQSFQAYFALLRSGLDSEVEHLVNAFTINETYFFREDHQLRCMTSDLLGAVIRTKRPGDPIRIWSVPCSTGEEPYSIAIWLMENFPDVDNYQIEIVGSDIDTRALAAAADGVYGARALMKLSPALIARYFERLSADDAPDRRRVAQLDPVHRSQSHRCARDGAARPVRHHLLPQRPHLFRRRVAPGRGGKSVRLPASGRLHLSRPLRDDEPHLVAVSRLPLSRRHRLPTTGGRA